MVALEFPDDVGPRQHQLIDRHAVTPPSVRLLQQANHTAGPLVHQEFRRPCTLTGRTQKVWDYDFDPGTNLVDVYIKRLREKLDAQFEPKLLQTIRGLGYALKEEL